MLLGTYDNENLDPGTKLLIRHLRVTDEILNQPQLPNKITATDFKEYWRKVKEKTSSSPSGRHFGHWKSIAKSNDLANTFSKLVSLPTETGYSPI